MAVVKVLQFESKSADTWQNHTKTPQQNRGTHNRQNPMPPYLPRRSTAPKPRPPVHTCWEPAQVPVPEQPSPTWITLFSSTELSRHIVDTMCDGLAHLVKQGKRVVVVDMTPTVVAPPFGPSVGLQLLGGAAPLHLKLLHEPFCVVGEATAVPKVISTTTYGVGVSRVPFTIATCRRTLGAISALYAVDVMLVIPPPAEQLSELHASCFPRYAGGILMAGDSPELMAGIDVRLTHCHLGGLWSPFASTFLGALAHGDTPTETGLAEGRNKSMQSLILESLGLGADGAKDTCMLPGAAFGDLATRFDATSAMRIVQQASVAHHDDRFRARSSHRATLQPRRLFS